MDEEVLNEKKNLFSDKNVLLIIELFIAIMRPLIRTLLAMTAVRNLFEVGFSVINLFSCVGK